MDIIKRLFIVIWTLVFTCITVCGGFLFYSVLKYIFTGKFDDMLEVTVEVFDIGKDSIEKFFDNLSNTKCKKNGEFWK